MAEEMIEVEQTFDDEVVEIDESIGWTHVVTSNLHTDLGGRDADNQHPINAIDGLRDELDEIEKLKTVYSDKPGFANYYLWSKVDDKTTYGAGHFVKLVGTSIALCNGPTEDIFGVTVEDAGFIGNQDEDDLKKETCSLVVTSGLVSVKCATDVEPGNYVVCGTGGRAVKSENGGFRVVATNDSGEKYASIALGLQANATTQLNARMGTLEQDVKDNEESIDLVKSVAEEAYQAMFGTSSSQLGGRNLLLKSGETVTSNKYMIKSYDLATKPYVEQQYTISIKAAVGNTITDIGVYNSGGMTQLAKIAVPNDSGLYQATFLWKNGNPTGGREDDSCVCIYMMPADGTSSNESGSTSTIEWIKLEKGTIGSEHWSAAYEELVGNTQIGKKMSWQMLPEKCVWWNEKGSESNPLMRLDETGLYVNGEIESDEGKIGGWDITPTFIQKSFSAIENGEEVTCTAYMHAPNSNPSPESSAFGISRTEADGSTTWPFVVKYNGGIMAQHGQIAGWNMDDGMLRKGAAGISTGTRGNKSLVTDGAVSPIRFFAGEEIRWNEEEAVFEAWAEECWYTFRPSVAFVKILSVQTTISSQPEASQAELKSQEINDDGSITITIKKASNQAYYDIIVKYSYISSNEANFQVLEDGSLYAKGAEISGKVTANSGQIAGWDITDSSISKDTVGIMSGDSVKYDSIIDGAPQSPIRFYAGSPDSLDTIKTAMRLKFEILKAGTPHYMPISLENITTSKDYELSSVKCLTTCVLHEKATHSLTCTVTSTNTAVKDLDGNIIGYSIADTSISLLPNDILLRNIPNGAKVTTEAGVYIDTVLAVYDKQGNFVLTGYLPNANTSQTVKVTCDFYNYEEKLDVKVTDTAPGQSSDTNIKYVVLTPKVQGETYWLDIEATAKYIGDAEGTLFMVLEDGSLYAQNADIRGNIEAGSGEIGNLKLENGSLISDNFTIETIETPLDSDKKRNFSQMRFYNADKQITTSIDDTLIKSPHVSSKKVETDMAILGDLKFSDNKISSSTTAIEFGLQETISHNYIASLSYNGTQSDITVNIASGGNLIKDRIFTVYYRQSLSDQWHTTTILVEAGKQSGKTHVSCLIGVAEAYFDTYKNAECNFAQYNSNNLIAFTGDIVPSNTSNLGNLDYKWENGYIDNVISKTICLDINGYNKNLEDVINSLQAQILSLAQRITSLEEGTS